MPPRGARTPCAARSCAFPGASRRPQGKVTGPITGCRGLCRPYGGSCRANLISPRSRGGASKCPPARVSQGSSDDVSCREMARFSKGREERHAWSGRYAAEARDPPPRTGRAEREHVASWLGASPTTGSGAHSRQLGNNSAKVCHDRPQGAALLPWMAEVVGAGGEAVGRASRAAAARGDRRGACRAVGEEIPWDTVSLRHPAPRSPFVRRVLGAHRGIGGGRSPQAVRE